MGTSPLPKKIMRIVAKLSIKKEVRVKIIGSEKKNSLKIGHRECEEAHSGQVGN